MNQKAKNPPAREDYALDDPPEIEEDSLDAAMNTTFRGLPLSYSPSAQHAAFRYGMNMMGLVDVDRSENGSYPGMNDDAAIVLFCSLCAADAGKDSECPEEMRGLLLRRTLTYNRQRLGESLGRFVDAFEISPMDEEIYEIGFGLIARDADSRPTPDDEKGAQPGK